LKRFSARPYTGGTFPELTVRALACFALATSFVAAGLPEAKTLITQAEVEQLLGQKVTLTRPAASGGGFASSWEFVGLSAGMVHVKVPFVTVWVADSAWGKSSLPGMRTRKGAEKVAGLGREAYWAKGFDTLTIYRADDSVLQIASFAGQSEQVRKDRALKLAKLALGRM
jgi:hypothetical protein